MNHESGPSQVFQAEMRIVASQAVSEAVFIDGKKVFVESRRDAVSLEGVHNHIPEHKRRRNQYGFRGIRLPGEAVDHGCCTERVGNDTADIEAQPRVEKGAYDIGEFEIAGAPAIGRAVGRAVEGDGRETCPDQRVYEPVKLDASSAPAMDEKYSRTVPPSPSLDFFVMDPDGKWLSFVQPSLSFLRKGVIPGRKKEFHGKTLREAR
jgi:hypothetical protein